MTSDLAVSFEARWVKNVFKNKNTLNDPDSSDPLGRNAAPYKLPVPLHTHLCAAIPYYLHLLVGSRPSRFYLNKALMVKHAVE